MLDIRSKRSSAHVVVADLRSRINMATDDNILGAQNSKSVYKCCRSRDRVEAVVVLSCPVVL